MLDLEVTAHSGYFWNRRWETDIIEQLSFGRILCYAAKWLGKKTFVRGWIDFRRNKELCLVKELWKLLDECDILIGQNCRAFDIKWCNAAFARYDLPPPSPYKVIDTKIEAKKYLYLPSYALNNLADYFGLGRKVEHEGFSLWLRCIKGDKQAWKRMKKYNKRDTELTEKIYLKLRSFIVSKNPSTLISALSIFIVISKKLALRYLEYLILFIKEFTANEGSYKSILGCSLTCIILS